MKTIAQQIIEYNSTLQFDGQLPQGFAVMNPFADCPETMEVMRKFYTKYYSDNNLRRFIIGINPSRHGAGITGIPFTDTKRLDTECGIKMVTAKSHEVSSVFVYDMIKSYGGTESFFGQFYINSPFPLAIVRCMPDGKTLNANYYDDANLFESVEDFMITTLKKHIAFGLDTSEVFVLGRKNAGYIEKINRKAHLFEKLTVLEHPRYIQQYKSKEKDLYIDKYIRAFHGW
jgi:hypothetical protein